MRALAWLPVMNRFIDWLEEKAAEQRVNQSRREMERQWDLYMERHKDDRYRPGDPQAIFLDAPMQVPAQREPAKVVAIRS